MIILDIPNWMVYITWFITINIATTIAILLWFVVLNKINKRNEDE